jgi:predicted ATP-grasp superfamily ATP-dependent carboligase
MNAVPVPAVILGIDTPIGLALIRDLGKSGVPVIGIGRSATALGMASRYLRRGIVRSRNPDALVEQLVSLGEELGGACLFTVSENDISLLNRYRDRLGAYKIMFADDERMNSVLNKDRTYAAAEKVGIRTPRTEQVVELAQAESLCTQLRFPVVLKWANPHEAARLLAPLGIAPDKTHYCHSPQQLLAYLKPFEAAAVYPLIQEYCAGFGLGQFILMKDGVAHYTFQHRRVHEWPPEGGFSSLCESVPRAEHQELMGKSIALLRELKWEGIAMVEYRHDPDTGTSALMEINGRFWGSLPLAYHAGARFATMCYTLFGLGRPVQQDEYLSGVRCRFMIPETKRLARILFAQDKIADKKVVYRRLPALLAYVGDFFSLRSRYYVFELSDPKPFFSDIAETLKKIAGPVLPKRVKRSDPNTAVAPPAGKDTSKSG